MAPRRTAPGGPSPWLAPGLTILALVLGLGAILLDVGGWRASVASRLEEQGRLLIRVEGQVNDGLRRLETAFGERMSKLEVGQASAGQALLVSRAESRTDVDRVLGELQRVDRETIVLRARFDAEQTAGVEAERVQNERISAVRDLLSETRTHLMQQGIRLAPMAPERGRRSAGDADADVPRVLSIAAPDPS